MTDPSPAQPLTAPETARYVAWLEAHREALIGAYAEACARDGDARPEAVRRRIGELITDMFIACAGDDAALQERTQTLITSVLAQGISNIEAITSAAVRYHGGAVALLEADDALDADARWPVLVTIQRALLVTNEATVRAAAAAVTAQQTRAQTLHDLKRDALEAHDEAALAAAVARALGADSGVAVTLWYVEHEGSSGTRAAASAGPSTLDEALDDPQTRQALFALAAGQPLVDVIGAENSALPQMVQAALAMSGVGAVAVIPLKSHERLEGFVALGWEAADAISPQARALINGFGGALAPQVAHRRLLDRLEHMVAARTHDLEHKLGVIQRQSRIIHALSTPILQVWPGVLALPIIGSIDSARSAQIMEEMLDNIARLHARWVILDVTGVERVDTRTASDLLRLVRAAELIGARCVLTGVRAIVAQTLVSLGVELGDVTTRRTLEAGLRHCMQHLEQR